VHIVKLFGFALPIAEFGENPEKKEGFSGRS
jgi:hypothetical protein